MYTQKSFVLKPADANKKWHVIDATDKIVGRLATEVAGLLRGKNNPQYTPHTDSGDYVVVVNIEKVKFSGNKWDDKIYYRHEPGYVGNLKQRTAKEQLEKHPELILQKAIKGMLPKNTLGRQQLGKLKLCVGPHHPHTGQKPESYSL
jgi:large subunit ribosomal protein L13